MEPSDAALNLWLQHYTGRSWGDREREAGSDVWKLTDWMICTITCSVLE